MGCALLVAAPAGGPRPAQAPSPGKSRSVAKPAKAVPANRWYGTFTIVDNWSASETLGPLTTSTTRAITASGTPAGSRATS